MRGRRESPQSAGADAPYETPIRSQIDLDAALSQRRPPPARFLVVALVAGLVVALAVPLCNALATQSVPTGAGHATALILSNVSTGTVTLNGRRMAYHDALTIRLAAGANTVVFDAPPFLAQQCLLTWPEGSDRDTCHGPDQDSPFYPHPNAIQVNGILLRPDYIIAFPLALPDLPGTQRGQALGLVRQLLAHDVAARRTTVQPGEHYATGVNAQGMTTPATAPVPLAAVPILDLDMSGTNDGCRDGICATAGSAADLAQPGAGTALRWAVQIPVWIGWQFLSPAGFVIANVRFPQMLTLSLVFDSARGWQLASPAGSAAASGSGDLRAQILYEGCIAGEGMVNQVAPQFNSSQQTYVTGQGCLIAATGLPASSRAPIPNGTFVWRFDVLLAADEATHEQVPGIPVAMPAERATVMG